MLAILAKYDIVIPQKNILPFTQASVPHCAGVTELNIVFKIALG